MWMDTKVEALPVRASCVSIRVLGTNPHPKNVQGVPVQGWDSLCWRELCLCLYL